MMKQLLHSSPFGHQANHLSFRRYSNYELPLKFFILEAIDFLPTHNFFLFDINCCLQKLAEFAPMYGNLYMAWWEYM
ncbi:hypothetical protein XELAEV_18003935mg [Xenopus laevis]|nr:hypothetical protein XELAEV_18003935mg [Xenopus laevis]